MGLVSASASDTGKRSVCDGKRFKQQLKPWQNAAAVHFLNYKS